MVGARFEHIPGRRSAVLFPNRSVLQRTAGSDIIHISFADTDFVRRLLLGNVCFQIYCLEYLQVVHAASRSPPFPPRVGLHRIANACVHPLYRYVAAGCSRMNSVDLSYAETPPLFHAFSLWMFTGMHAFVLIIHATCLLERE